MKDIHANPQFRRERVMSLNGEWEFEILSSPYESGLLSRRLSSKINVPFCPESKLSGIGYTDFIEYCAYAKTVFISRGALEGKVLLWFGACDYEATVYVNGVRAGRHRGGYSSFNFEISALLREGENRIFVVVYDNVTDDCPSGKQSFKRESFGCFYTRVTGVWQSVWMEFVPESYIERVAFYPDIKNGSVRIRANVAGSGELCAEIFYKGKQVGNASRAIIQYGEMECRLSEKHLWEEGKGRLYDVVFTFCGDVVHSYFGLRECCFSEGKFLLNGKPVFQRFVLNQGYHPEGIYTLPTTQAMREEIEMATRLGFNGARLHQKVFEPQYLYECDKSGFLVWEELPSWGVDYTDLGNIGAVLDEWREIIERDFNHPCIITWCPANEFWTDEFRGNRYVRLCDMRYVKILYDFTKTLDSSRPCVDASGGYHTVKTDLYDFHIYRSEEETEQYLKRLESENILETPLLMPPRSECRAASFSGQAVMASEFGGISYGSDGEGWGYSVAESSGQLAERVIRLCRQYMRSPRITGMCYTQLYDVEQEKNGLYYYDRRPKLSEDESARLRAVLGEQARIEEE